MPETALALKSRIAQYTLMSTRDEMETKTRDDRLDQRDGDEVAAEFQNHAATAFNRLQTAFVAAERRLGEHHRLHGYAHFATFTLVLAAVYP